MSGIGELTGPFEEDQVLSHTEPTGRPVRILVDGRVMQDRYHGIGRYTFELMCELSRREVDLILLYNPDSGRLDVSRLITQPTVRAVACRVPVASVRSQWQLPRSILTFRPDVVFVPYHLTTPLLHGRVPIVSVIQDCIFERNAASDGLSAFSLAYRAVTRLAIRSAARLLAPSEATSQDITRFYGVELTPEAIVPYGVGAQFFSVTGRSCHPRAELPERYILHVGARRPHKNQRVLVEALAALRASHPDLGLVLVGQRDSRFPDEVEELIEKLDLSNYVFQYTQADDEVLLDLYANATVFAFPSLIEGFGLPVLEAMAAGLPVVASDANAVQEAAAGGALIVPARLTSEWVRALHHVLSDPDLAQDLRKRARSVAARHTWGRSAELTLAVLESAASQAKGGGHDA
jgi:glycosyltransferase involved in cell wall biosynthesis